jgi:hypothetical protein
MSSFSSCTVVDLTAAAPVRAKRSLDAVIDLSVSVSCPAAKRSRVEEVVDLCSSDEEGEETETEDEDDDVPIRELARRAAHKRPASEPVVHEYTLEIYGEERSNELNRLAMQKPESPRPDSIYVCARSDINYNAPEGLVFDDKMLPKRRGRKAQPEVIEIDEDLPVSVAVKLMDAQKALASKRQPEVIEIDDDEDMVVTEPTRSSTSARSRSKPQRLCSDCGCDRTGGDECFVGTGRNISYCENCMCGSCGSHKEKYYRNSDGSVDYMPCC